MNIPDLPPDLSFPKLVTSPEDQEFAFEVKRAAIGPYIIQRWGWDDNFQRDVHDSRYREKPFYVVRRGENGLEHFRSKSWLAWLATSSSASFTYSGSFSGKAPVRRYSPIA